VFETSCHGTHSCISANTRKGNKLVKQHRWDGEPVRNGDARHSGPSKNRKGRQRRQNLGQSFKIIGLGVPTKGGPLLSLYDADRRHLSNLWNGQRCYVDCETAAQLLANRLAQPCSVPIIAFASDSRAGLRQPSATHGTFQRTTRAIYCPYSVDKKCKATEPATAAAAGMRQPGASRRVPVEHLYREIVGIPGVVDHTDRRSALRSDAAPAQLLARRVSLTRFPVFQRRFRLDPDSASI
jgi:hypothetical protein